MADYILINEGLGDGSWFSYSPINGPSHSLCRWLLNPGPALLRTLGITLPPPIQGFLQTEYPKKIKKKTFVQTKFAQDTKTNPNP